MIQSRPSLRQIALLSSALLLIAVAAVFITVRSQLFARVVRSRIIAFLADTTGGEVDLDSFHFDWQNLTADMRGLRIYGAQGRKAEPIADIPHLLAAFPVSALWRRETVIRSLQVFRPVIHLAAGPDGITNLPHPRRKSKPNLAVDLNAFTCVSGVLTINLQTYNLDWKAENVSLVARERRTPGTYQATFSSANLTSPQWPGLGVELSGEATATGSALQLARLTLRSGASIANLTGTIGHWTDAVIDLNGVARLDASLLRQFSPLKPLLAGSLSWRGALRLLRGGPPHFAGELDGSQLAWKLTTTTLLSINVASTIAGTPSYAALSRVRIESQNGSFTGAGELTAGTRIRLAGNVQSVQTQRLARLLWTRSIPFSGIAAGSVHVQLDLAEHHNLSVDADLTVRPGPGVLPISGTVRGSFREADHSLALDDLQLHSPGTDFAAHGQLGQAMQISATTSEAAHWVSVFPEVASALSTSELNFSGATAQFKGTLTGLGGDSEWRGPIHLQQLSLGGVHPIDLHADLVLNRHKLALTDLVAQSESAQLTGALASVINDWRIDSNSPFDLNAHFRGFNVASVAHRYFHLEVPVLNGNAEGSATLRGTLLDPRGSVAVKVDSLDALGQHLNRIEGKINLSAGIARIDAGRITSGAALLTFSGEYQHPRSDDWQDGRLTAIVRSNGFPLSSLSLVRRFVPSLNAIAEVDGTTTLRFHAGAITPEATNGQVRLRNVSFGDLRCGVIDVKVNTGADAISGTVTASVDGTSIAGNAKVLLETPNNVEALLSIRSNRLPQMAAALGAPLPPLPFESSVAGTVRFTGPLEQTRAWQAQLDLPEVKLTRAFPGQVLSVRNAEPVLIRLAHGLATLETVHLVSAGTDVRIGGSAEVTGSHRLDLAAEGSAKLQLLELLNNDLTVDGTASGSVAIRGTLEQPLADGRLQIKSGSAYYRALSNGLTEINGFVRFNRTRATLENLTAQTGGGRVALAGFFNYGSNAAFAYNLSARADGVRLRAANAISVTGGAALQVTGTAQAGLVSGDVVVERVVVSSETDLSSLLALTANPVPSGEKRGDLLSNLQIEVAVHSAPNLQISAASSRDVQADLDLHLRGTPQRPLLFGSVNADGGTLRIFGAKYILNRGEVTFTNTARIEPVLNLDLQTVARGVTVNITVTGTMSRLSMNYRSDPPLQPKDIIALLTVGKAPSFSANSASSQPVGDVSALQAGVNTVLGQAISPPSSGLSKLFGITNIKIDPLVQGITNTPQSRLTVEQQISQNVTVTYVTNLAQTSEQIFRFEWALNPRFSVVAIRDDNGEFGIDIQFKKRFK